MVIQLYCEILLAENSRKPSKSDLIIRVLPGKSKDSSDSEYDGNPDDLDYRAQYLDDFDSYIIRNSINSDNKYAIRIPKPDLRVIEVPTRKSISSDSEYEANLRQLSDRKMRYPDSDPHVTKVPARRSQSSNRNSNYLELYSDPSSRLDLSGRVPQSQRRNLEILPRFNSKYSDIEHTIDLIEPSERRYLHPDEVAYVTDQISARNLQGAQRPSRPSLRPYPNINYVQQSNTRRFDLKPAIKLAQLGVEGLTLLPEVIFGDLASNKRYNDDYFRRTMCPKGTQLVNDRCEPIFSENRIDATIEKNVGKSDNLNSNRFR